MMRCDEVDFHDMSESFEVLDVAEIIDLYIISMYIIVIYVLYSPDCYPKHLKL